MSGLATLLVSASDHMGDCHWQRVCGSADAQRPRTRVDDHHKIALDLLRVMFDGWSERVIKRLLYPGARRRGIG